MNRFVLAVAHSVPSAAGQAVYRAAATFEEVDRGRSRSEQWRYLTLCERVRSAWAAKAIEATGRWWLHQGLQSLEPVSDPASAEYARQMLNSYRRRLEADPATEATRRVLLHSERALRVAGRLPLVSDDRVPYERIASGVEAAADALVSAWEAGFVSSLPEETATTMRLLDAPG